MSPVSWLGAADDGKKHSSHTGLVFNIFMCAVVVAAMFFIPGLFELVLGNLMELARPLGQILVPAFGVVMVLLAVWLICMSRNDPEGIKPPRWFIAILFAGAVFFAVASIFVYTAS
jgi:hypothetical protein